MLSNSRGDAAYGQAPNHQQTPRADTSRLPPMGNFAPTPTANRDNKRKRGERQGAGAAPSAMPTPVAPDVQQSSVRTTYGQGNANKVRSLCLLPFNFKKFVPSNLWDSSGPHFLLPAFYMSGPAPIEPPLLSCVTPLLNVNPNPPHEKRPYFCWTRD
jgi:hypothetical protein